MNREALPSDEPRQDAALDDRFEQPAEHVALGKAAVAVLRERGVVRHWLVQPEAPEPAIRQVQMHLSQRRRSERMPNEYRPPHVPEDRARARLESLSHRPDGMNP